MIFSNVQRQQMASRHRVGYRTRPRMRSREIQPGDEEEGTCVNYELYLKCSCRSLQLV